MRRLSLDLLRPCRLRVALESGLAVFRRMGWLRRIFALSNLFVVAIIFIMFAANLINVIMRSRETTEMQLMNLISKYELVLGYPVLRDEIVDLSLASPEKIVTSENLMPTLYWRFRKPVRTDGLKYELAENMDPFTRYSPLRDTFFVTEEFFIFTPSTMLFPTEYKLKLCYKDLKTDVITTEERTFLLIYSDVFARKIEDNPLWKSSHGVVSIDGGVLIKPVGGYLLSQLVFQRRFQRNVFIELSFTPLSEVVNLQVFLGEAYSIMIGDGDNRTVTLKKAVAREQGKVEKAKARIRLSEPLEVSGRYTFRIERLDSTFRVIRVNECGSDISDSTLLLSYYDSPLEQAIEERFKTIGFAVWRGSDGVEIRGVRIFQPSGL